MPGSTSPVEYARSGILVMSEDIGNCPSCGSLLESLMAYREVGLWGLRLDRPVSGVGYCPHCASVVKGGRVLT